MNDTATNPVVTVDNETKFTERYFLNEVDEFRRLCGDKSFWNKTEEQHTAIIHGLSFVYLNIVNDDGSMPNQAQIDQWGLVMSSALTNYEQRKTYLVMLPLKRHLGIV